MNAAQYDYFPSEHSGEPASASGGPSPVSQPPSSSPLAAVRRILSQQQDLLRNAGSLIGTTGVTSVFGFGYWIYAARFFLPEAVGYGTAAVSVMMLLSTIGISGFGTMLIGELPRLKSPGRLMMAGILASFILSIVLGLGFSLVSLAFGNRFVEINGTFGRMVIFSFGVAITSSTFVFDDATIGLMRGGLQLSRNVAFSVIKIVALPVCALFLHDLFGVGIMFSWVLGTLASLIPVVIMIKRGGASLLHRPDWKLLWELRKVTLAHNWLNVAINTPARLIPVLVVLVVAPADNAAFYIASMLASFLTMIPTSLSTVLFAIASAAPELIGEKLRFVLRTSLLVGVLGGLVLGLSSHLVLSVFGSSYVNLATGPLWILIAAYIPELPNTVYIAVCRATGRVNQAAIFLTATAGVQMGAVVVGGKLGGLYGLSFGILGVATLQALVTAPSVLRAAYGSSQVHSAVAEATEGPVVTEDSMRLRQEAGLAALLAMATTTAPEHHRPTDRMERRRSLARTTSWIPRVGAKLPASPGTGHHRRSAIRATMAHLALTSETSAWQSVNDATFHEQQQEGLAALIMLANRGVQH